jgi:hypothetical protein
MFHKLCLISFLLIFIGLYLYVKREHFYVISTTTTTPTPTPTPTIIAISTQLVSEIAKILNISKSRINNLTFSGDITKNTLQVSFNILDRSAYETSINEKGAVDANNMSQSLFSSNKFIVYINGHTVTLSQPNISTQTTKNYFDNNGLTEISDYSKQKYVSVPTDKSLTNF